MHWAGLLGVVTPRYWPRYVAVVWLYLGLPLMSARVLSNDVSQTPSAEGVPVPMQLASSGPVPGQAELPAYLVSEKLDGIRGRWTGSRLESRTGNYFNAPGWFTACFPTDIVLDGELWAGRQRFEWTIGVVRGTNREADWRQLRFMVFDSPMPTLGFAERLKRVEQVLSACETPYLSQVPQQQFQSLDALNQHLQQLVADGAEGLMLHHRDATYIDGRNSLLIKLKPLSDAEGEVIGYKPRRGALDGVMGALKLRLPDGTEFYLGSGFDLTMRRHPPPIGAKVTFEYNGLTRKGKPKGARFLRIRPSE